MPSTSVLPVPVLRGIAALVVGASVWSGSRALVRDVDLAFHVAGHSVFPPTVALQIDVVRRSVPRGDGILILSASHADGAWYTRLFQRALYPRNRIVVRYEPLSPDAFVRLRETWGFRWALLLAPEPSALSLVEVRDLGSLPAMPDRVWLGRLAP